MTNERTVTSHQSALGSATERTDFVDSAARVEAAGSLTINAGQDVNNTGGVLSSGTTTSITATRDVNITAAQAVDSSTRTSKHTRSTTTQNSATATAGTDLSISAGQDLTATASQLTAGGSVALSATDNLSLSSAADETHSYSKTHKVTSQQDHVAQVATTVTAGGSTTLQAGQDVTLTSSNVTAGTDAYVYAGDKLQLLAAQNSDYSLYDMKKKGSFGSKKTQHDETTQVTNVGSAVTSGGDLTLASNGDQLYQAAKLNSGNDLTISSGGAVTFEAVKDLDQETHTKSSSNLAWTSAKGKGNTDETLQQTEMVAKGKTVINAVNGLNIDVKQINQETVSQVIDTMVKADPSLSWIKDAEARGDINWQQVKEVHDSFKYSTRGR
ncbi:hemagglutinin repeat-containing protein [Pseudomonas sp. M47T1]|uniref:hemagglutinin repeat-containing protein n=1 Tax=Pseudomonas sp. M47T1 TaxID=1179778 RepID=UPI00030540EA